MIRLDAPLDPILTGVNDFVYTPDYFYNQQLQQQGQVQYVPPLDSIKFDNIDYKPIQEFIPEFPDYTLLSCEELRVEVSDLSNILETGRFIPPTRLAYEKALSDARAQIIARCSDEVIKPVNTPNKEIFEGDSENPVKTQVPAAQGNPTFYNDVKPEKETTTKQTTDADSKKYLYAGLGIVVILIIANMLKKK